MSISKRPVVDGFDRPLLVCRASKNDDRKDTTMPPAYKPRRSWGR